MTDRDDAFRRDSGWTGPEETGYEPPTPPAEPAPPLKPPMPSRPSADFVAPEPGTDPPEEAAKDPGRATRPASGRVPQTPSPDPGPQPAAPPPPPFLDPERPIGSFREPPRYGPRPGSPRDTGPLPTSGRPDDGAWSQPGWQTPPAPRPAGQTAPPPQSSGARTGPAWQPSGYGPDADAAPPPSPGSYADRIRADDLVPSDARCRPVAAGVSRCTRPPSAWSTSASRQTRSGRPDLDARIRVRRRAVHDKVGAMG